MRHLLRCLLATTFISFLTSTTFIAVVDLRGGSAPRPELRLRSDLHGPEAGHTHHGRDIRQVQQGRSQDFRTPGWKMSITGKMCIVKVLYIFK